MALSVEKRINPSRRARNVALAHLSYRVAQYLRLWGMAGLVGRIKQNPWVNRFLYQPKAREATTVDALPDSVVQGFRKDYDALEDLIGRRLPDSWRQ